MSTHTADYLEAIDHLPAGATLRLRHMDWDEYEQLLDELAGRAGLRVSYDQGRLEIMSPLPEHEEYKEFILRLAHVLSEELGMPLETRGSATYKRERTATGAEPDTSFYVQNAAAIIGKRKIDLNVDPPPDIVVEIDLTHESLSKFPIYAALGVPEIWHYNGERAQIYNLVGDDYIEASASRFFAVVSGELLAEFIERSKQQGQSVALAAFRQRVQARRT
ncbi:MAG: Uma2 family endonuclease [Pyrinomonadaceae bacterium]|nr:Uma2 family endonuclease [Pyrinomonadaceae bacterium]